MNTGLKYDLYQNIKDKTDLFSVLLKDAYFNEKSKNIVEEKSQWINKICMNQMSNGSWYSTVIGTVVNIDYLLLLQVDKKDPIIQKGVEYLFANLNEIQIGDHVGKPYGFSASYMFSTKNRNKEFEIASQIKPEWIPRNICYRHLGMIQNSVCLNLLLKLDFEKDKRVKMAIDNLVQIEKDWNGFCDSDIKKVFMENTKNK